jgi:4-hydroxyphenylacetate 3-monooxygenase
VLRTGKDYIESLRDGREVWIDGERVGDVPAHPAFAPMVNVRARIYDLAREAGSRDLLTYADDETAERCATTSRPPRTRDDWRAKRASVDAILDEAGGVVTRVGDETVGEMWSLFDGQDVLTEIDPAFSANIARHVRRAQLLDPFHVSANTDPKGNRSLRPQDQDPDVLLHVVGETDNGIVVRGAKFETAAAYANQAFVKPTIGSLGDRLIAALQAGLAAGGEISPVRSAGMVIAESVPWPVTDLRVDWHDDPVGQLAGIWELWRPQAASYVRRALHPAEAAAGAGEQPPGPFGK